MEVIENPVLNSPYEEPTRHFRFSEEGITSEVVEDRRSSSYFVPIPKPKKKGAQLAFDTEWTQDRVEENAFINRVRFRMARWRLNGYTGVTKTTRQLLDHWTNPERERKLFFCQIEALETAIYITEVANKSNDTWTQNTLQEVNENANPLLSRMALKMATGSGKTVVMAMLISWQALNKLANPQDNRFSDAFLVVAPGITIRDRLRVLLPTDPHNSYRERDILPLEMMQELFKAKVAITNFHAFKPREHTKVSKLGKSILNENGSNAFTESPDQMVRRVLRDLGTKKSIVVLNDEAHHCYRRKPEEGVTEKLTGDDKQEAKQREEEARVWISGLEAIQKKVGVKQVYDLSAAPFFLRGSGYSEGTLFPWVVSDFSLIDAIESGIVNGQFETTILENLKRAGVQNTVKKERLIFDRLEPYAGTWIHAEGDYTENGSVRSVGVCIGPQYGTVGSRLIQDAAKEAVRVFDLLMICGMSFDPHVYEEAKRYPNLTIILPRMNADLSMGDELLKKTGAGNLFTVFGEPDIEIRTPNGNGKLEVEIKGLDIYDPTTGQIRSNTTDDIACWFIDTNYSGNSFIVRHAYFTGADKPYEKLKKTLKAEVDEAAWSSLYSTVSRPFDAPEEGRIAVKVINHYGDEVLKVCDTRADRAAITDLAQ